MLLVTAKNKPREQKMCGLCAIWGMTKPATHVGNWDDGEIIILCGGCVGSGAGNHPERIASTL